MKLLVALGLIACVALAGCGSTPAGPVTPPMEGGKYVIHLTPGLRFEPPNAAVPLNATVVFVNDGGGHDVSASDGSWSSNDPPPKGLGRLLNQPGERFEMTFPTKGVIQYECHMHLASGMKATLTVG